MLTPPFSILSDPLQYREGKKLKPKPNYNSVDLSEVEWEDQAEIVSGKQGVGNFLPVSPVGGSTGCSGSAEASEQLWNRAVGFCAYDPFSNCAYPSRDPGVKVTETG